jgi:heme-degrading monooxygenase HmoA
MGAGAAAMIARHWRGVAKAASAQAYVDHLRHDTFPALRKLEGFIDASILRRAVPDGVEFLVITHWDTLEAIAEFAGDDIEAAVVPPAVQAMMVDYDRTVRHYEAL